MLSTSCPYIKAKDAIRKQLSQVTDEFQNLICTFAFSHWTAYTGCVCLQLKKCHGRLYCFRSPSIVFLMPSVCLYFGGTLFFLFRTNSRYQRYARCCCSTECATSTADDNDSRGWPFSGTNFPAAKCRRLHKTKKCLEVSL